MFNNLRNKLDRKNILFIGLEFYYFHIEIIKKLENYGAKVTFFPERNTSILYGIVNRLFNNFLENFQNWHYTNIINKVKKKKFDYLLVIRGYKMPSWFVKKIKKLNPGIICIMYQWDANTASPYMNLPPKLDAISEFDKKFSFDYDDVMKYPDLSYCPTFSSDAILNLNKINNYMSHKYDLFYFGSYLPERYEGLIKIKKFTEQNGLILKTHLFMSNRYYFIEYFKGNKLNKRLLSPKPMSKEEYLLNFKNSKAIVDVSNRNQTGLSMRVIDAFASGKKIITTNKNIVNEFCYNEKQVAIIELDNIKIQKDFLENEISHNPMDYSIDNWLFKLFCS